MSIYAKLLKVQEEIGAISKTSKNPFFKSKYFDINKLIEVVNPILSKHGVLLLQPIDNNKVISELIDAETGDNVSSSLELPNLTDPQKIGSAISYYRRYTLSSLLGLQAEDEDGNDLKAKPRPIAPPKKQDVKDWVALLDAVANGKVTKEVILKGYNLTKEEIEKVSKIELISKIV